MNIDNPGVSTRLFNPDSDFSKQVLEVVVVFDTQIFVSISAGYYVVGVMELSLSMFQMFRLFYYKIDITPLSFVITGPTKG